MRVSISQSLRRDFLCWHRSDQATGDTGCALRRSPEAGALAGVGAGVSRDSGVSGQDICCSGPVSRGRAAVLHPPSPLHPLFRLHLSVSHRSLTQHHPASQQRRQQSRQQQQQQSGGCMRVIFSKVWRLLC